MLGVIRFSDTDNVITLGNLQDDLSFVFLAGSVCPLQSFSGRSNQSFRECYTLKA